MTLQERQTPVVPKLSQLDLIGDRAAAFVDMRAKLHWARCCELASGEHILVEQGQVASDQRSDPFDKTQEKQELK